MSSPSFRVGMRVVVTAGWLKGEHGTVQGSEFDEETRAYSRYVVMDEGEDEILIPVSRLRPLDPGEYFMEQLDTMKRFSQCRLLEMLLNPVDFTRPPAYRRKIPRGPIQTGKLLHIKDMPDSLAGVL